MIFDGLRAHNKGVRLCCGKKHGYGVNWRACREERNVRIWHEVTGRHLDWSLFRRFVRLIRPYRVAAVLAMVLLPMATAARLVQPFLVKIAIDNHIVPGPTCRCGTGPALFLAAACVESVLGYWHG